MSAVSFQSFQTLDVTRFRQTLARLHESVGCSKGRVEVTRRGCTDVCVLISKSELESLEQALEILTASAEYKAMCDQIQQLVAACDGCTEDLPQAAAAIPDATADRA
jgi:PHD/YefM family antitoxin component YafN of YafNO toxin-antitoxin module